MLLALVLAAAPGRRSASPPASTKSIPELQQEARAAYDKGDRARFVAIYEDLVKRRPGDAYLLYNLACGQALTGQTAAAEKTLLQLAALRAASDLDADTDFDAIRQSAGYRAASAKMKALRERRRLVGRRRRVHDPGEGPRPGGRRVRPEDEVVLPLFDPQARGLSDRRRPERRRCSSRRDRAGCVRPPGSPSIRAAGRSGSPARRCPTWKDA